MILCLGRTGSTHLWSLLDSHPEIRCFGELLNDSPDAEPEAFVRSDHDDVAAYLEELLAMPAERVVGLKLPMNSLRAHPAAASILDDPAVRVIRLRRRNRLEQLVSRRLMAKTDIAHSIYGSYGDATVRIEPDECIAALERIGAEEAELDALAAASPRFDLDYEQIGCESRLTALQRFLDVEPAELRSWFTKLRTRPLERTIANFDQLRAALEGTDHARFLPGGGH